LTKEGQAQMAVFAARPAGMLPGKDEDARLPAGLCDRLGRFGRG